MLTSTLTGNGTVALLSVNMFPDVPSLSGSGLTGATLYLVEMSRESQNQVNHSLSTVNRTG